MTNSFHFGCLWNFFFREKQDFYRRRGQRRRGFAWNQRVRASAHPFNQSSSLAISASLGRDALQRVPDRGFLLDGPCEKQRSALDREGQNLLVADRQIIAISKMNARPRGAGRQLLACEHPSACVDNQNFT